MAKRLERDLTSLEYIVLGLISIEPQTGYSIVTFFDGDVSSWSASPGSIYPMLKRLEKQEIIAGELEMTHETRPRKMYTLTALGASLLDDWLRQRPNMRPFYQERELAMWRFQFMERRLPLTEVIHWLKDYLATVQMTDAHRQIYHDGVMSALDDEGVDSVYRQLVLESSLMEINSMRTWLEMSISRLTTFAKRTGEFDAVPVDADDKSD